MKTIGFIILRHVKDEITSIYWKKCYESIRIYYPNNKILIIDDNSNYQYIDSEYENTLVNTEIIINTTEAHGEILPYIYFLKHNFADIAVFIHDSVFINKYTDFSMIDKCKMLWSFSKIDYPLKEKLKSYPQHLINQAIDQTYPQYMPKMIKYLDNHEKILHYFHNADWTGCFGGMSAISYTFLCKLDKIHKLSNLIPIIRIRQERMLFERLWACLIQAYDCDKQAIYGNIFDHPKYSKAKYNDIVPYLLHLPAIKIWTGR